MVKDSEKMPMQLEAPSAEGSWKLRVVAIVILVTVLSGAFVWYYIFPDTLPFDTDRGAKKKWEKYQSRKHLEDEAQEKKRLKGRPRRSYDA